MILVFFKKRKNIVPAPTGEPELAPMIVIGRLAAHIDHGVDRGRAADNLTARVTQAAAIETFFGFGLEAPVRARITDGKQISDGDVKPYPIVAAAGFEQKHALVGVAGKTISHQTAGGACADNDIIVLALVGYRFAHRRSRAAALAALRR